MSTAASILTIDDNPETLALLVKLLGNEGYRVLPADSGQLGLSAAASQQPDLILLDIRMPGLDGIETCRRLKADPATKHIPVILMSAYTEVTQWTAGLRAGAADFVNKPFQPEELLTRIKTQLELGSATFKLEQTVAARTQELRQANLRLDALWSLTSLVTQDGVGALDARAIYDFVLEKIVAMTASPYGFFGLLDESESVMTIHSWSGQAMADCSIVDKPVEYRIAEVGIWGEAIRNRRPLVVNDYAAPDPAKKGYPGGHVLLSRLMVVPAFSRGRITAVAAVANKAEDYDEADLRQFTTFMEGIALNLEHRKIWAELKASELKYHSVADFTYDLETWRAPDGSFVYVSPSCERITGYTPEEFMADPKLSVKMAVPEDQPIIEAHYSLEGQADQGEDRHVDFRFTTKDGRVRWISHYCRQVVDNTGKNIGRRASNRDITDRKLAEERIQALLREKDLLLCEVHHRIKNNMNSVSSLLSLQKSRLKDQNAIDALETAQHRLRSMGLLYEKLYRSNHVGSIAMGNYLLPLVKEIVDTIPCHAAVTVVDDIGDFELEAPLLQPLGIAVNEIVTNSLKYAFEGRTKGVIRVAAGKTGKRVCITLGDDGIGLPPFIETEKSGGLGLVLIKALVEQLDGTIRIERVSGTQFILEFDA
ncbi:MAG: response regulator [Spirochaetia bacterium]|nr:response regulator [Spirochaetia bacterium]